MVEYSKGKSEAMVVHTGVPNQWACSQCTLLNPATASICAACRKLKPESTSEPDIVVAPQEQPRSSNQAVGEAPNEQGLTEPLLEPAPECYVEYLEEDPLHKKRRRRRRRRFRMVLGGIGGLVGGAILFCGPAGLVIGTVAGVAGARCLSKRGERKKDAHLARVRAARENAKQADDLKTPAEVF